MINNSSFNNDNVINEYINNKLEKPRCPGTHSFSRHLPALGRASKF